MSEQRRSIEYPAAFTRTYCMRCGVTPEEATSVMCSEDGMRVGWPHSFAYIPEGEVDAFWIDSGYEVPISSADAAQWIAHKRRNRR